MNVLQDFFFLDFTGTIQSAELMLETLFSTFDSSCSVQGAAPGGFTSPPYPESAAY